MCCAVLCCVALCAVQALATQQASMAQQLLVCGADPLVQCLHTRLIKPSSAQGAKGINNWRAVPWRTTVLHMLLGESAGLLLGPVPWPGYVELQQLCLQMAIQLAASDKVEALLDKRVNEDGEGKHLERSQTLGKLAQPS
jgi:hypothetical protein